jgi:3-hydroxyisobutyrate dehydrogenase
MRAAYIGLGNMGAAMVERLVAQGVETTVFDLSAAAIEACVAKGAKPAVSGAAAAESCDAIGICVPEDDHVRSVLRGSGGVLASAKRGAVIAVHSTILPSTAEELARDAEAVGLGLLDACVTGGAARAVQGKLVFMVGGEAESIARIKPYLDACGERVVHAGAIGNGAKLKLCINLITYLQWIASFEAMTLARASGLSQQVLEEAGRGNGQITEMMIQYMALHKAPEAARKSEGMRNFLLVQMHNAEKDLAWALKLARDSGVSLPGTALASQLMARVYAIDDAGRR